MKATSFKTMLVSVGAAMLLALTLPALAHHSFAMFDESQEVELVGTIKEFQWTNPHIWIQVMVMVDGEEVEYSIEGGSPNTLTRRGGWSRDIFKPGDKVVMKVHPMREGRPGGAFISATFPDGRVLTAGGYAQD